MYQFLNLVQGAAPLLDEVWTGPRATAPRDILGEDLHSVEGSLGYS